MGRIKARIAGMVYLGLLITIVPVTAQESAREQKAAAPSSEMKERAGTWKKVASGIWEAKISRFPHKKAEKMKPEFAVLRLSSDRYAEFQKNRKDFLNDHKIFSKDVRNQDSCPAPTPDKQVTGWYVIITHWPSSTAACTAYPAGSESPDVD